MPPLTLPHSASPRPRDHADAIAIARHTATSPLPPSILAGGGPPGLKFRLRVDLRGDVSFGSSWTVWAPVPSCEGEHVHTGAVCKDTMHLYTKNSKKSARNTASPHCVCLPASVLGLTVVLSIRYEHKPVGTEHGDGKREEVRRDTVRLVMAPSHTSSESWQP